MCSRGMNQRVDLVSREQWGAAAPRRRELLKGSALRVVVHHTALRTCRGPEESRDHLVGIQRMHMAERRFDDIGYNFLVAGDGTVYEGRGWSVVGAHSKGNNHDSLGIAYMGNFNIDSPSAEAMASVRELLRSGLSLGFLHPEFVLLGHRDLATTECPGEKLYTALPGLRLGVSPP